MKDRIKALREERVKLWEDMQGLINDHPGDEFTSEIEAKFDAMNAALEKKEAEIKRLENMEAINARMNERNEIRAGRENISAEQIEDRNRTEAEVFNRWAINGMSGLSADDRQFMMERRFRDVRAAQGVGTGAAGGFLVPEGFVRNLEEARALVGPVREAATVLPTDSGNDLPWPTLDETAVVGELLGENTAAAAADMTFGQIIFQAYKYSSKIILVPMELMQDSAFDLNSIVPRIAGDRLGRIENQHYTTGTGTAQPNGMVTASTQGRVGTTGQTTSVIYDDLVELEHSVDPAYRAGAGWMLHDSSLKVIKLLKDSQGRPLWKPGLVTGDPDTINDYPYHINQDMPVMAANAKSILFGALSKYMIREVRERWILRLEERYAESAQVGFITFERADGDLLDAGTNPVKHYANSAT